MQRLDNDTWNLATSVGATATMAAAGRARATIDANPLIEDRLAEPLVRAVGIGFLVEWANGESNAADVDVAIAAWGMQPMTDIMAARTRYFDRLFDDAVAAGIRQVVILASGLDSRGYRLSWPDGMSLFEIDQPAVLQFKARTLALLNAAPATQLRAVGIDLRQDWPTSLRAAGFDSDLPTAWLAEGLLPFLPTQAQDRLMDDITTLSSSGSWLAVDDFLNSANAEQTLATMDSLTTSWRERGFALQFSGLLYPGRRNDVASSLRKRRWSSVVTPLTQLLTENRLALPRNDIDRFISDSYYCTSILGT